MRYYRHVIPDAAQRRSGILPDESLRLLFGKIPGFDFADPGMTVHAGVVS